MRKNFLLLLAILLTIKVSAQTDSTNYVAVAKKFQNFYNNNQPDSIYKMFGPQMTAALTPDAFRSTTAQLRSQLGNIKQTQFINCSTLVAKYKVTFQNAALSMSLALNNSNQITGLLFKPLQTATENTKAEAPAATSKVPSMDASLAESPLVLKTLSGSIHGTLTMPKNAPGKIPVVLIIAGSGPTDRNGNSPKLDLETNAYRDIAEELGKNNIASLRYDKRMIGESETHNKEADLRFDDYVDDAVGIIQILSVDERFSKVIVLGHSEGSLVGMLACRDQPVKGYISVAGAGDRADKILTEQLKSKSQTVQDHFKTLLDSMKRGKTIDDIDPSLWFIARPTIQRYLISWFRYDPQRVIKAMKIPTLIIQGTTDLQVSVADAEKLKKAKSDAQLVIIPNMNHVLKDAPSDQEQNLATYNKPDLPLKAELMPAIVKFINEIN